MTLGRNDLDSQMFCMLSRRAFDKSGETGLVRLCVDGQYMNIDCAGHFPTRQVGLLLLLVDFAGHPPVPVQWAAEAALAEGIEPHCAFFRVQQNVMVVAVGF